jgi:predicted restriction endonuclease
MPTISQAKEQLDVFIGKQRPHMYKPIQVAEILHKVRTTDELAMEDIHKLEEYRTKSRHWRAEVSRYLNGTDSTSSARYQDDVFNDNAIPPHILYTLTEHNLQYGGVVERYIYQKYGEKH